MPQSVHLDPTIEQRAASIELGFNTAGAIRLPLDIVQTNTDIDWSAVPIFTSGP